MQIATDALDRLHTTAESHYRNVVVEVMGRNAGWIALHSGIAGGADVILMPERPFDLDDVVRLVQQRQARGSRFSIIVVAEGARPHDGELVTTGREDPLGRPLLGGIGHWLQTQLEQRIEAETRAVVLGHLLRGGTPTAYDRVLASRFGEAAFRAVRAGQVGTMVALRGDEIELVSLSLAATLKLVPQDKLDRIQAFLG